MLFLKTIKNYFKRTEKYSIPRYVIELTIVAFLLKFLSGFVWVVLEQILIATMGSLPELGQNLPEDIDIYEPFTLVTFITFTPIFETLVGQVFPIWLVSKFTKKISFALFISSIIFSSLHLYPFLIINTFPVGLILAWTYILYRKRSFKDAFLVTSLIHALHNIIALILQYFL